MLGVEVGAVCVVPNIYIYIYIYTHTHLYTHVVIHVFICFISSSIMMMVMISTGLVDQVQGRAGWLQGAAALT